MLSLDQFIQKVNHSTYKLDLSGVVGMLGGNNAVDALETIHLYRGRKWAGWYNYPGTVTVAKRFGQMADSRVWNSLFPGPNESPAVTLNLAGKPGPRYNAALSGTKLDQTKHLGHLIAQECAKCHGKELHLSDKFGREARKTGSCAAVTVISLPPHHHNNISRSLTTISGVDAKKKHEHILVNPKSDPLALWAIIPSLVSILACAFCVLGRDFLCASLLLLGIICSGISSITFGTATLKIRVPVPSPASPPGDGLLLPADGSVIVLKGQEADVNIITKGEFELDYSNGILPHRKHHMIGVCSLLLMTQFLVQLLLIPLCTFFGQIMYLLSFIASGVYHLYVVSRERDKVQRELLLQKLSPQMDKWTLGTRTQMAVLVCLVLGDRGQHSRTKPEEILKCIIPNHTPLWEHWRRKVLKELALFWKSESLSYQPSIQAEPEGQTEINEYNDLADEDKRLLQHLVDDAWCVFNKYLQWRDSEAEVRRERVPEEKSRLLAAICLV